MSEIVLGMKSLEGKLNRIVNVADRTLILTLESCAETIRTNAVKSIQTKKGSKTATRYRKGGNPRVVIVSPEGSPPNTDTGNLVRNIQRRTDGKTVEVGSFEKAPYGKHLEFGTYKMGARPWLRPALKEGVPIINAKLSRIGLTLKKEADV